MYWTLTEPRETVWNNHRIDAAAHTAVREEKPMEHFHNHRVWGAPTRFTVATDHTVFTFLEDRARRFPHQPIIERRREVGGWHTVSAQQLLTEVDECARGLIGLGLEHGDKLSIMSATRPEWTIIDLAALSIGVIVVPIYESDSVSQIQYITEDAQPKIAICDTHARTQLVEHAASACVKQILSLESGAMRTISQAGLTVPDKTLRARRDAVDIDCLATVIYTSGTTGHPKGVMLTHRNFVETVYGIRDVVPEILLSKKTRFLLFLPLAHVFARFVQIAIIYGRGIFAHTADTRNLLGDIESFQPSILLLVPRVLEKVYNAAEAKAGKGAKRRLFRWAANRAIRYSQALETRLGPTARLRREHALAQRLVLNKVKKALGPNMRYVISGGAPLSPTLGHFFRGVGFTILEGWGLSETTGPLTLTPPGDVRLGSVGRILPGNQMTLDAHGEVLVRGCSVTPGYFNDPQATEDSLAEGWFKTGDQGHIDKKGNLYLTGRVKDIIVTAGGKNVAPAALEETLVTHPLISHVVVVGDQKPYIGALITLDAEMLPAWLKNHGLDVMDTARAANEPRVLDSLTRAIRRSNKAVSKAESIRRFRVVNTEFTVDNGYLTPSMKLKRTKVVEDFAEEIEKIYSGEAQDVK
ncbi:MAG: long-chain fatty acid--CoA ligase [Actinomycetaceae bacterium]|nr:long-chain fatty acid--CoA ligase [Actinomycetaceae bacterium]